MSRSDWERGEIVLPSAEYARFRQAMQDAERRRKEQAFELTQTFWKGLSRKQQNDPASYESALREWGDAHWSRLHGGGRDGWRCTNVAGLDAYVEAKERLTLPWGASKPQRVKQADMDYPTNRSTSFTQGEASVIFDRSTNTVIWSSGHNNRAVERAHDSGLGRAFFGHLRTVRWTHGTGGVFTGNDEYNREASYEGGGANYVTDAYGYLGIERSPENTLPFTNARGQQVKAEIKVGRYGFVGKAVATGGPQGRVKRGVPSGGQFAARQYAESDVEL